MILYQCSEREIKPSINYLFSRQGKHTKGHQQNEKQSLCSRMRDPAESV